MARSPFAHALGDQQETGDRILAGDRRQETSRSTCAVRSSAPLPSPAPGLVSSMALPEPPPPELLPRGCLSALPPCLARPVPHRRRCEPCIIRTKAVRLSRLTARWRLLRARPRPRRRSSEHRRACRPRLCRRLGPGWSRLVPPGSDWSRQCPPGPDWSRQGLPAVPPGPAWSRLVPAGPASVRLSDGRSACQLPGRLIQVCSAAGRVIAAATYRPATSGKFAASIIHPMQMGGDLLRGDPHWPAGRDRSALAVRVMAH